MATDSIELDCPSCSQRLEIDAGFAGGVCRCSNCGTLMTVPSSRRERPQRLRRPERPGEEASGGESEAEEPVSAPRPARPGQASAAGRESWPAANPPTSSDHEIYTTDAGEVVRVSAKRVPIARLKRKAIRATVVAVFLLVVGLLVGACVVVILLMRDSLKPKNTAPIVSPYSQDINPFTVTQPNMLGFPVQESTVVAVDASAESEGWLSIVKEALAHGVPTVEGKQELQIVVLSASGISKHPEDLERVAVGQAGAYQGFVAGLSPGGSGPLAELVTAALDSGPRRLILVTGRYPTDADTQALTKAMQDDPDLRVDYMAVSSDVPPELNKLIEERQGNSSVIARTTWVRWKREANER